MFVIDGDPRSIMVQASKTGAKGRLLTIPFSITFDGRRVADLVLESWKAEEILHEIDDKVRNCNTKLLKLVGLRLGRLPLCIFDIQFYSEDDWCVWIGGDDDMYVEEVCNERPFKELNTVLEAMIGNSPDKDTEAIMSALLHGCGLEKHKHLNSYLNSVLEKMDCFEGVRAGHINERFLDFNELKQGRLIVWNKLIGSAGDELAARPLLGKKIAIAGQLRHCKNRDELAKIIEFYGGEVVPAIKPDTSYLITNDIYSANKNAREKARWYSDIITILDEEELFGRLGFKPGDLIEIKKRIGL